MLHKKLNHNSSTLVGHNKAVYMYSLRKFSLQTSLEILLNLYGNKIKIWKASRRLLRDLGALLTKYSRSVCLIQKYIPLSTVFGELARLCGFACL